MTRNLRLAALLLVLWTCPGAAQEPPRGANFLFIDQDRILTGSARGQALLAEEEAARDTLRATAREIETAFETEERELTERRTDLDPTAFRALADDFDQRVVAARAEQDERANALALEFDQKRREFYADVGSVLVRVMEGVGALAIFDQSTILLADQALNVTDEVIAEIDRAPAPEAAGPPAPAPEAPAPPAAGSD